MVVDALGDVRPVVLVAQSIGGLTVPLVCEQVDADLLILVNAMIPKPGGTGAQWCANTEQAEAAAEYAVSQVRDTAFDPVEDYFHDVPESVKEEAFAAGEPPQSGAPFGEPWPLSSWPAVPTRVIVGRDDRQFPAEFQRRVAEDRLKVTPEVIPGGTRSRWPIRASYLISSSSTSRNGEAGPRQGRAQHTSPAGELSIGEPVKGGLWRCEYS